MDSFSSKIKKAEKKADGRQKKSDKARETFDMFGKHSSKSIRVRECERNK
jgi:hypothetical protein